MAKVKSIKFYNFVELSGSTGTAINVRFYDIKGKLILIDFSNPMQASTSKYCENSEYIVTSYDSYSDNYYPHQAFHTSNKNLNLNFPYIGRAWIPATQHATLNDFLKIKFKFPQYISKIEILHSYSDFYAIDTVDYDVEFDNKTIKTYHFKSNGTFSPIENSTMNNFAWNQNTLDSLFSELQFDKSKQIYDSNIGLVETLDTNNFRNVSKDSVEKLKVLYIKPVNTLISCLISFNRKQTWKTFNGNSWIEISDTSANNMILNCMDIEVLNSLNKNKLLDGGFTGDLDFKIAMKTNDKNKTPSVTKIYIEYK